MHFPSLERYRIGGSDEAPEFAIPIPQTPTGGTWRFSPNSAARPRHFVVAPASATYVVAHAARARMKLDPRSDRTVCPYSGIVAPDAAFMHPDDHYATTHIVAHAFAIDSQAHFARLATAAGPPNGYRPPAPQPRPTFVRADLQRTLRCDHCARPYAVYAIALYCPDCGAPNVRLHFRREIALVEAQLALAEAQPAAAQELAYRLHGNAHEDVVSAFEATLKTIYLHGHDRSGGPAPAKPRNAFQNLQKIEARFAELGVDPFAALSSEARTGLALGIQKRHVFGHNLGVADETFAAHAPDARVGQTISTAADEIRSFATLAQVVVDGLDAWLGGSPSPFD